MKKRTFVSGVAMLSANLFLVSVVTAASVPTNLGKNDVKVLGVYNGQKIVSVGKFTNGKFQEISFDEYVKEMESKQSAHASQSQFKTAVTNNVTSNVIKPSDYVYWYDYSESSGYFYNASPRKASADFSCPSNAGGNCTTTIQYSLTQGKSASISLGLPEWSAIKTTLGYVYNDSATVSASYSLPIPPGKTGYMTFSPRYHHSEGYLTEWENSGWSNVKVGSEYVGCETPQKLSSGQLDGLVAGVIY